MNRNAMPITMVALPTLLLAGLLVAPAAAQTPYGNRELPTPLAEQVPRKFEGVGVEQKLDAQLPMDARFVDHNGNDVSLGKYFDGKRPVVMMLVYYRCPSMCNRIMSDVLNTLREVPATAGEDFEIVIVSFDPGESPRLAFNKRLAYVNDYNREAGEKSWHLLTGDKENIDALCDAVGFSYKWVEATQEYTHDSAVFIVTGEGRMSQYLFHLGFNDPKTMRIALTEASDGKIGSLVDVVSWLCSHYDPEEGTYAASAMKIVKTASPIVAVLILLPLFVVLRIARRRRLAAEKNNRPNTRKVATA